MTYPYNQKTVQGIPVDKKKSPEQKQIDQLNHRIDFLYRAIFVVIVLGIIGFIILSLLVTPEVK